MKPPDDQPNLPIYSQYLAGGWLNSTRQFPGLDSDELRRYGEASEATSTDLKLLVAQAERLVLHKRIATYSATLQDHRHRLKFSEIAQLLAKHQSELSKLADELTQIAHLARQTCLSFKN